MIDFSGDTISSVDRTVYKPQSTIDIEEQVISDLAVLFVYEADCLEVKSETGGGDGGERRGGG